MGQKQSAEQQTINERLHPRDRESEALLVAETRLHAPAVVEAQEEQQRLTEAHERLILTDERRQLECVPTPSVAGLKRNEGYPVLEPNLSPYSVDISTDIESMVTKNELEASGEVSVQITAWCESLRLHDCLAKILHDLEPLKEGDPLQKVSNLKEMQIQDACLLFQSALAEILKEHILKLNDAINSYKKTSSESVSRNKTWQKFSISSTECEKMECGNIDDFHKGLAKRIGNNKLIIFGRLKFVKKSK